MAPVVRHLFAASFVLYPISVLVLALFIGFTIGDNKLERLYKQIQPEQKYAGYDSNKGKSIYKDDIDKYVETSEILIGKNADNFNCRQQIMNTYNKYRGYLLPELSILLILSIVVLFLG